MKLQRLDAVADITMGQAPDGESYNLDGVGLPLIAGAGDFGELHPEPKKFTTAPGKTCQAGDIILGIRATIGEKVVADGTYCLGRGVAGIRPKAGLNERYLWHWLTHATRGLAAKAKGATFKQVNREDIGELLISLPPLPEQRRIAGILDKADALRAKRRAALKKLDELTQSIFLDMFGDPVTNPRGWGRIRFGEFCDRVTVGIVVKPASYYASEGVPALRSLNIKPGRIDLGDLVFFSESDNETRLAKTRLKAGDLVLVRSGQPGTAAVVPPGLDGVNAIDLLIATPRPESVDATFLCQFFNSKGGRNIVLSNQRGQVQKHLNVGSLCEAQIPLPPIELQREFARRVTAVEALKAAQRASLTELDALFASLQHRAFRGEL